MTEENKAIARRLYQEIMKDKSVAAVDQYIAADVVEHNPSPGQGPGLEGVKQMFGEMYTAFPDLSATVDLMISEGDMVTARITMSGTHSGDFAGMPATGKKFSISGIDTLRIANGQIVERWGNFDEVGMMQQLGMVPEQ